MKTKEQNIEHPPLRERTYEQAPEAPPRPVADEDEIDLTDLARQLWARRKVVWITMLVAFVLGLFIAIVSPEEYEASVVLMPQSSEASGGINSGLLRQFGGLAGLSLGGGGSGTLTPTLYPNITQSTPFFLDVIERDMYFSTLDTTVTLRQYFGKMDRPGMLDYLKTYTIGLPRLIINLPVRLINAFDDQPAPIQPAPVVQDTLAEAGIIKSATDEPIILTGEQRSVIGKLMGRITTTIEDNNTVKITAEMPDPLVAAEATEMAADYLTNYILEYRTEKVQQDLEFVQKQFNEKQTRYNAIQRRLARFRDRNLNIISETARIEQEQLESENQLAFGLYQSLAQQLEQAKIKVQEETPVFKVLEPIQVPMSKSKPNRELIIILSIFVGAFLGLGIIFLQILYQNARQNFLNTP